MAMEILIADSDKADQDEFKRIFENTDYHPVFSDNGEDALLRAKLFKPDLIIAGVSLSEKDGLDLCEAIKTDQEFKGIPFILLTEIFEDISEKDRARVGADGIISKPLREAAILTLVDQLMEDRGTRTKRAGPLGEAEQGWDSFPDFEKTALDEKDEFSLEGLEETEEEIIELVDVVEEPEPKMSINDFVALEKEGPTADITPLESWEEIFEEEKKPSEPAPKTKGLSPGKVEKREREVKAKPLPPEEKVFEDEELFEKIELEEILEKVERLKPSLEKEWPAEDSQKAKGFQLPVEEKGKATEWQPLEEEERKPVEWQPPTEEEGKATEWKPPVEEEEKAVEWQLPREEAAVKFSGLEDFESALKGGVVGEPLAEELQPFSFEEPKAELSAEVGSVPAEVPVVEEEVKAYAEEELKGLELEEEELPEALLEEEEVEEKDIIAVKEIEEERIDTLEGLEAPSQEPLEETIDLLKKWEAPKPPPLIEFPGERAEILEGEAYSRTPQEEPVPPPRMAERQMEEVIAEGVQVMMEEFIKKVLPEMTQNIIGLTVERIEKMVREIVPDIAERAIQEEIKRLQKGEKE